MEKYYAILIQADVEVEMQQQEEINAVVKHEPDNASMISVNGLFVRLRIVVLC